MMTMKQGLRTLTLAAAVAAGTLAPAVPAGASPAVPAGASPAAPAGASPATPAATAEPAAQAAARRYCLYGGYAIAKENIKIRTKPKVNATPLGLVLKNKTFSCHHGEDGERYTLCGKTSAVWQYITYNGMTGYIPGTCTKPRS